MISASVSRKSKYQITLRATGLIFSVAALTGFWGMKQVSDKLEWTTENETVFYKVNAPSEPPVYDLGKDDGTISGLGGRVPSWKLAYFMSLHPPLNVIGVSAYNPERSRLKVPSSHNYLVKSYIAGGILGALTIAELLIFSIVFYARFFLR